MKDDKDQTSNWFMENVTKILKFQLVAHFLGFGGFLLRKRPISVQRNTILEADFADFRTPNDAKFGRFAESPAFNAAKQGSLWLD